MAGNELWAWGDNDYGQIGDGTNDNRSFPVQNIISGSVWSKVSSGSNHTLGIKTDGTLWSWGEGNFGQLGNGLDGNENKTSSPFQIGNLSWKEVSAGIFNSAAIRSDGTLWTWGENYGTLGLNDGNSRSSPVQVGSDNNWKQISNSVIHTLAIRTDGTLWGWGEGNSGQLGQNDTVSHSSPVQITIDSDWKQVSAAYSSSFAVKNDGTLWSWGNSGYGVLGNGTDFIDLSSPTQVGSLSDWASVSATLFNAVAVKTDGTLWAWGEGGGGTLGQNDTASHSSPVQVGNDSNWASACVGSGNVAALKSDGTLWTWGYNYSGELGNGDGTGDGKSSPIQIASDKKWGFISCAGSNVQAITYSEEFISKSCSSKVCNTPAFKCYVGSTSSCTCSKWRLFTAGCTRIQASLGICNGTSSAYVPAITVCNLRLF